MRAKDFGFIPMIIDLKVSIKVTIKATHFVMEPLRLRDCLNSKPWHYD